MPTPQALSCINHFAAFWYRRADIVEGLCADTPGVQAVQSSGMMRLLRGTDSNGNALTLLDMGKLVPDALEPRHQMQYGLYMLLQLFENEEWQLQGCASGHVVGGGHTAHMRTLPLSPPPQGHVRRDDGRLLALQRHGHGPEDGLEGAEGDGAAGAAGGGRKGARLPLLLPPSSSSSPRSQMAMGSDTFPMRIRSILLIHQPWYFSMFWALVRPFLKAKLTSRLRLLGGDLAALHALVPPAALPPAFGGTLSDAAEPPDWLLADMRRREREGDGCIGGWALPLSVEDPTGEARRRARAAAPADEAGRDGATAQVGAGVDDPAVPAASPSA